MHCFFPHSLRKNAPVFTAFYNWLPRGFSLFTREEREEVVKTYAALFSELERDHFRIRERKWGRETHLLPFDNLQNLSLSLFLNQAPLLCHSPTSCLHTLQRTISLIEHLILINIRCIQTSKQKAAYHAWYPCHTKIVINDVTQGLFIITPRETKGFPTHRFKGQCIHPASSISVNNIYNMRA